MVRLISYGVTIHMMNIEHIYLFGLGKLHTGIHKHNDDGDIIYSDNVSETLKNNKSKANK